VPDGKGKFPLVSALFRALSTCAVDERRAPDAGRHGGSSVVRGRSIAAPFLPARRKSLACKDISDLPACCPQPYPHLPGTTGRPGTARAPFLTSARSALIGKGIFMLPSDCPHACPQKTGTRRAHRRIPGSAAGRPWISPGGSGPLRTRAPGCAVFDRVPQVPGGIGFFPASPRLSSCFSTAGGDKRGRGELDMGGPINAAGMSRGRFVAAMSKAIPISATTNRIRACFMAC